ncbi:VWA domain-containing protein [Leucobacter albus]|uniref:VWA domain-containing protein n=1 Tax=Leucobacter albus TaxID=272210 RepID=UPI0033759D4E
MLVTGLPTAAFAVESPLDPNAPAVAGATAGVEAALAEPTAPGEAATPENTGGPDAIDSAHGAEGPEGTETPAGTEAPDTDESPGGADAPAAADTQQQAADALALAAPDVAPAAVPTLSGGPGPGTPPGAQEWLIRITATGDRTAANGRANLAGAAFSAFQASSLTNVTNNTAVATCTTDQNGQCWMKVPTRGSGNSAPGYVVRAVEAPAGWSILASMNTSEDGLGVGANEPYSFYTGPARSDVQQSSRIFTPPTGTSLRASSGTWSSVRNNPSVPKECGIDVALLVDLSTSVRMTGGALTQVQNASAAVVDALTGTPSRVALQTFSTKAPAEGSNNAFLGLTSVATPALAGPVKTKAQNLSIPSSPNQYTNWDAGLWSLNGIASQLDAVIMITDGLPTRYGTNGDGASATRFFEMENAIASANAIKAKNTKIIAVGVGLGVQGNPDNLKAISGKNAGDDFFQVSNWNDLEAQLRALASGNCDGTVNVTKQVIPVGGTVAQAQPRSAWGFSAATQGNAVRVDAVGTSFANSASGLTGDTGVLGFRSNFDGTSQADRRMSVTETLDLEHTLAPQGGKNAVCTRNDTGASVPVTNIDDPASPGFAVDPIQNATITCTVYNQAQDRSAQLRVNKVWQIDTDGTGGFDEVTEPNEAPTSIPGLSAALTLSDNTRLPSGVVSFGETVSNLALDSTVAISETVTGLPLLCTNEASYEPELPDGKLTLELASDEGINEVTITNTVTCESKLTLEKWVSDGQTPAADWTLDALAQGDALAGPAGTSGSAAATANVTPGATYPLAEQAETAAAKTYVQQWNPTLQAQWAANHALGATGSWVCVVATGLDGDTPVWATNQSDGRNGGVTVQPGGWTKCTAVNDPKPTLELVKQIKRGDDVTTVALGDTRWTLSADWAAPTAGGDTPITPYPGTQAKLEGAGGTAATPVLPGSYTLAESAAQSGYENGTQFSCVVNDEEPQLIDAGAANALNLDAGDTAKCTIVNTQIQPPLTIEKSDGEVTQLADGTWQIDYALAVENATAIPSTFTLTDRPALGAGFSVVTTSWRDASDPGTEITAPAADTPIAGNTTKRYVYRVIAAFDPEAADPSLTCDPADGGALFNSATVAFPGGDATDTGCAEPAAPAVVKSAQASAQNADGSWKLSYQIQVTNTSDIQLAYTLDDTAAALPAGATGGDWTVADPTVIGGTPADSSTLVPEWAGAGELATGVISAGATHTYVVSRDVTLGAATTAEALECTEDTGLWNTATVTNGIGGGESSACATVELPGVTIDKTVTSVTQAADGSWVIGYDVQVTNTSATLIATYSLSDELRFGGEIVVDGADWTGPAGAAGSFAADGTATLATDAALAAGGSASYQVTARATIAQAAWASESAGLSCEAGDEAGGFLNTATVTAAGVPQTDSDCAEPAQPSIAKSAVSAVQDATDPETWHVSYLLTVTPSGFDTFYSLTDTPDFADGIVLGAGTAKRTDVDPNAPAFPITAGAVFDGSPVALGADDAPHTWLVTWDASIAGDIAGEAAECGEPGSAFFNTAALLQGGETVDEGSACLPVTDRVYPTVEKTVVETTQQPDGSWKIEYAIRVAVPSGDTANPDGLSAKYDLDDTLTFGAGIEVTAASWTGPGTGAGDFDSANWSAELARDRSLAAGATHEYLVTVSAKVTAAAITDGTTECEPAEGEAGGFLNTAKLTSGPVTTPVEACAEPVLPSIEKTGGATTDNGDGTFGLSYDIAVRYTATGAENPAGVNFTLTDEPQLPAGVELVGNWSAAAVTDHTPAPDGASWNGTGEWTIVDGAEFTPEGVRAGHTEYRYTVTATVKVTTTEKGTTEECVDTGGSGIVIPNIGRIASGDFEAEDDGCQVVTVPDITDVSIEKTAELAEDETSVQPGDVFDYVLTVTNEGNVPATDVLVTDTDINDRLKVTGLTVDPNSGWGPAPGFTGNTVELSIDEIGVGESVEVRVTVEFLPAQQLNEKPILSGDPKPSAPEAIDSLANKACVEMEGDSNAENNCDDAEVPTRDLTATVYTLCVADAPLLGWSVDKSELLKDLPVNFRWTPDAGTQATVPAEVTLASPAGATNWSDEVTWPGSAFTPSGISIDYPGWRAIRASDLNAAGKYLLPGTATEMTPAQVSEYVFNGLILDPSELDFAWRGNTTIEFSVNPELTFNAGYPPATAGCGAARHSDVQIEKDASVKRTQPGKAFDYTLAVQNESDDAAAEGVVVTDQIPKGLRVTNVSWAGKGEPGAFPNWRECDVTGKDSRGYGGTLSCELFGPLQPKGSTEGASAAPEITLAVIVDPGSTRTDITNTATVDYHTFGDPDDSGRDSDSANVLLWGLSVTGGQAAGIATGAAALLLLGGAALLVGRQRRRAERRV